MSFNYVSKTLANNVRDLIRTFLRYIESGIKNLNDFNKHRRNFIIKSVGNKDIKF